MHTPFARIRGYFRGALFVTSLAALSASGATAHAADPRPIIESAESLYAELSYAEANKVVERLTREQGLSHDILVRTYRMLAITHAILDHPDSARSAFRALLTYEPAFPDPKLSPRIQAPYMEARGFVLSQSKKPGLDIVAHARARDTTTLRVTTRDPTRIVSRVSIGYRWGASQSYTMTYAAIGDSVLVEVPAPPPGQGRLDYYAQALDLRSDVVFESGNPPSPRSAVVEIGETRTSPAAPPESDRTSRSVVENPAFWAVTAIFLAGGAAATYFATRPQTEEIAATSGAIAPVFRCGAGAPCR